MTGRPLPIVVWGTGSNSGKTHTCVGIARSLVQRGVRTMPFKAVTVVSRETSVPIPFHLAAARVPWNKHAAPVVVRHDGSGTGVIEVHGQYLCRAELSGPDTVDIARLAPVHRKEITAAVDHAIDELSATDVGVLLVEGAGSPVEATTDLANVHVVRRLVDTPGPAPTVLFTSYAWSGGSPAALIGTHALMPQDLRQYLSGFLLANPMPGAPVARWADEISRRTGMQLLGVLPKLSSYEDRLRTETLDQLADRWGDAMGATIDLSSLLGEHNDTLAR